MKTEYVLVILVLLHYLYTNYMGTGTIEKFDEVRFSKSLILFLQTEQHNYFDYLVKLQELMVEFQQNFTIYSKILTSRESYQKLAKLDRKLKEIHVVELMSQGRA